MASSATNTWIKTTLPSLPTSSPTTLNKRFPSYPNSNSNSNTITCSLQTLHFPKKYQPTSNTTTTKTTTTTTATTPARETKPVIASPSETKHPLPQKWNFLQKAAASALDMVKTALVSHERQHPLPKTANPRVQIAGNFTPVPKHLAHQFLPVIGKIPKSIECVYVRNGANPLYEPVAGNHFFDSNDMVHVVKFHSGAASYTCHFTETQCLSQEKIFGRHVFPKAIGELHNHSGITRLLLFYAHSRPSS